MADRLKDDTDRMLESMFRSEPVPDDGFSSKVVTRVHRRMWIRRLTMPVAIAIGGIFAAKPLMQLVQILPGLFGGVFQGLGGMDVVPGVALVDLPTVILGGMLLVGMLMVARMLEE